MAADESGPTGPDDRERETDDSRVGVPGCSALPTGLVAAAAGDDNSRRRSILHRSQATSALKATARDRTVHLKTNASGPLSASPDDTPIANATTSSTPKKVVIALKILSKSARLIFMRLSDALRPELAQRVSIGIRSVGSSVRCDGVGAEVASSAPDRGHPSVSPISSGISTSPRTSENAP